MQEVKHPPTCSEITPVSEILAEHSATFPALGLVTLSINVPATAVLGLKSTPCFWQVIIKGRGDAAPVDVTNELRTAVVELIEANKTEIFVVFSGPILTTQLGAVVNKDVLNVIV